MQNSAIFVIPMAGESSRFRNVGFEKPKFMLPAFGQTVFDFAIGSFAKHFKSSTFIFIHRDTPGVAEFLRAHVAELGIADPRFVPLAHKTDGQAETVALGLAACNITGDQPISIFNIDSFRLNFALPDGEISAADGYLEVFKGQGDHWSFAKTDGSTRVLETAEKRRISPLCSNGFYHFRRAADFLRAFDNAREKGQSGEYFIAPLYNALIAAGQSIHAYLIPESDTEFCGLPTEYRDFLLTGAAKAWDGQNPALAALRQQALGKPLDAAHLSAAAAALTALGRVDDAGAMQTMAAFARRVATEGAA